MAKKKKINKNLVAFLTVMGIVLSVSVVAIATYQNARKDPEVHARVGRDLEAAGDFERAAERFRKAYSVNNDARYAVDAARCAYGLGDIQEALGDLRTAHSQAPTDAHVMETMLEHLWELHDVSRENEFINGQMREFSNKLLKQQVDHVFALVCNAEALRFLSDVPRHAALSEQSLQRAIELAEHDPHVALVRAMDERERGESILREGLAAGGEAAARSEAEPHFQKAVDLLQASSAEHPGEVKLVLEIADLYGAMRKQEQRLATLRKGVEQTPDDPDLNLALGRLLAATALEAGEGRLGPEAAEQIAAARARLQSAVERAPALYRGHIELARLAWLEEKPGDDPASDVTRRGEEMLRILDQARESTVGIRSVRASLDLQGRAMMYFQSFELALSYYDTSKDAEERKAILARIRDIYEATRSRYPAWYVTPYLEARIHVLERNIRAAIQAFEMSDDKFGTKHWLPAVEQLALLYRQENEHGLALKYTETAIGLYEKPPSGIAADAPDYLHANKAQLYVILKRPAEALNYAQDMLRKYPNDDRFVGVKAAALRDLGREGELGRLLKGHPSESPRMLMAAAAMAMEDKNYAEAEAKLRTVLEKEPENTKAVKLLSQCSLLSGRRTETYEYLSGLQARVKDEDLKRYIRAMQVVVTIDDPEERDAKLLVILKDNPDPVQRAGDLYNFWIERNDLDKAIEQLEELANLAPDDPSVVDKQFAFALSKKDYEAAAKLALRLRELNADRAGGATYRGRLELMRGNIEAAIAEFRTAEEFLSSSSKVKTALARALIAAQPPRLAEALASLQAAVEGNPLNFQAHKLLYGVFGRLGRESEAIAHLMVAAELNPNDEFVKARKQLLDEARDPQAGIVRREALLEKNPDDVDNLARLAELYSKTGRAAQAESAFEDALSKAPTRQAIVRKAIDHFVLTQKKDDALRVADAYASLVSGVDKIAAHILLANVLERFGDIAAAEEKYLGLEAVARAELTDATKLKQMLTESALQAAGFFRRTNGLSKMIEAYGRALDRVDPARTDIVRMARLRIIEGLLALERYGDAEKQIDSFVADFPQELLGLAARGRLLVAKGESQAARRAFSAVLDIEPGNSYALFMRGAVNLNLHEYAAAKADLLAAKERSPDGFGLEHRLRLVETYQITGQFDDAEQELRDLIGMRPNDTRIGNQLVSLYRKSGRSDRAQQIAREFAKKHPDKPFWPYQLGLLLMENGQFSAAVAPFRQTAELARGNNPALWSMAFADMLKMLNLANRSGEALSAFEALDAAEHTPLITARAAEAHLRATSPEAGRKHFERAFELALNNRPRDLAQVAGIAQQALTTERCLALMEPLIAKLAPDNMERLRLQVIYAQLQGGAGRGEQAVGLLDEVLGRLPPRHPLRNDALHIKALAIGGDAQGCADIYVQIIENDPRDVVALNNLAFILAEELDRPKEALEYAKRTRMIAGLNPNLLDTLGWVQFLSGDATGAERTLREAIGLDGRNIAAMYHLGKVYLQRGLRSQAREVLEQGLRFARDAGNDEYVRKIEDALREAQ